MSKTQNLGIITSYGYAVAGGYIGTVEDYENYLANLPNYTEQARVAAGDAQNSARTAEAASQGVVEQADRAEAEADDAEASATAAAASAASIAGVSDIVEGYKTQAQASATSAASSATSASTSANSAHDYSQASAQSAQQSATSATNAASSASTASTHATNASTAETNARAAKDAAVTAQTTAAANAVTAQSWAVGHTNTRSGEDSNNAKYWAEQAEAVVGLSDFVGATSYENGMRGLVPAPLAGYEYAFLRGDGTWTLNTAGTASNVEYANTVSGLQATNVQNAIDEVNAYAQGIEDHMYSVSDSTESSMADDDYIPFYDVSAQATKKLLKTNLTVNVDSSLSTTSGNPVANSVITTALNGKADISSLATVATSGSYSDLTNTPNLATVATSGSYSDLSNTPNLATVATSGAYSDLSGTPNLATVATSGSYADLTNRPSLGDAAACNVASTVGTTGDLVTDTAVTDALADKTDKPLVKRVTLEAGQTTVTFTDLPTDDGDYIADFFNTKGIPYTDISPAEGSVTLTFSEQSDDVYVYCTISEYDIT